MQDLLKYIWGGRGDHIYIHIYVYTYTHVGAYEYCVTVLLGVANCSD